MHVLKLLSYMCRPVLDTAREDGNLRVILLEKASILANTFRSR